MINISQSTWMPKAPTKASTRDAHREQLCMLLGLKPAHRGSVNFLACIAQAHDALSVVDGAFFILAPQHEPRTPELYWMCARALATRHLAPVGLEQLPALLLALSLQPSACACSIFSRLAQIHRSLAALEACAGVRAREEPYAYWQRAKELAEVPQSVWAAQPRAFRSPVLPVPETEECPSFPSYEFALLNGDANTIERARVALARDEENWLKQLTPAFTGRTLEKNR